MEHVPPLQAYPAEQSAALAHPQLPPMHVWPLALLAQLTQAEPEPQAVAVLGMHMDIEPPQQ